MSEGPAPQRGHSAPKPRDFSRGRVRPASAASTNNAGNINNQPSDDDEVPSRMPYADHSEVMQKKISRADVDRCLTRLYSAPVQAKRKQNAELEAEMTVLLNRATKPAQIALVRGRELAKEYRIQKQSKETPTLRRPSSVPLAPTRPPTSGDDDSTVIPADEIELKSAKEFVDRFYDNRKDRKDKIFAKLSKKFLEPMPHVMQPPDVTADSLERLYTRRPDKEKVSALIAKKVYGPPAPRITRTKGEAAASVQRLFHDTIVAKQEKLDLVEKKWQDARSKKSKKVDAADLTLIVERLAAANK